MKTKSSFYNMTIYPALFAMSVYSFFTCIRFLTQRIDKDMSSATDAWMLVNSDLGPLVCYPKSLACRANKLLFK